MSRWPTDETGVPLECLTDRSCQQQQCERRDVGGMGKRLNAVFPKMTVMLVGVFSHRLP